MNTKQKGILIGAIITQLNVPIIAKNKQLCKENNYSSQSPLHGADMFFTLAYKSCAQIRAIAKACGI